MVETVKQLVQNMIVDLENCEDDCTKFDNGNGAAGARVRAVLLETRNSCNDIRKEISARKNA